MIAFARPAGRSKHIFVANISPGARPNSRRLHSGITSATMKLRPSRGVRKSSQITSVRLLRTRTYFGKLHGMVEGMFSYSHKDEQLRDQLAAHLAAIRREA